jgi:hypothetical protein
MGFKLFSCDCCPGGDGTPPPCDNCLAGEAPRKLKLVVPGGTFTSVLDFAGDPQCPGSPGCSFYEGTYLFDMLATPQTSGCDALDGLCCDWFLCFDGPDSDAGCDCTLAQGDCKAFCHVTVSVIPPDGVDPHYRVQVAFIAGNPEQSICGDCHFGSYNVVFEKAYGTDDSGRPDCLNWNNESIPISSNNFNTYCQAVSGAAVLLTAV